MENSLPEIYRDSNETIRHAIITLGSGCYLKLFKGLSETEVINKLTGTGENPMLELYETKVAQLDKVNGSLKKELNDNYDNNLKSLEAEGVKINLTYKNEIDNLNNEIIILKKGSEEKANVLLLSQNEKHEAELQRMKDNIDSIRDKHSLEVKCKEEKITTLCTENENKQKTIDEFIGRRQFKNNTEQGNYGEKIIDEIVEKGLPCDKKADCIDSSKVGGSGDRIIKFDNGKNLMVEVKLKGTITKEDREQFETHYQKDFEEKKCDAALFLSLMSEQIPTIGDSPILHYKDSVGYYGLREDFTMSEKKIRIERCIHEMYCEMNNADTKVESETENKSNIYNTTLEILVNQKKEYERVRKIHTSESDKINENLIVVNQKLNDLYREIQVKHITIDRKLIDEKLYLSELIKRIREWKVENNITFKKGSHNKIILEKMTLNALDRDLITSKKIKQSDLE
jgi:hypothetical protein